MSKNCKEQAEALMAKGYRKISNRHKLLARVDDVDWRDKVDYMFPGNEAGAPDQYRRCYSRDRVEVSAGVLRYCKPSGHDPVGYVEVLDGH